MLNFRHTALAAALTLAAPAFADERLADKDLAGEKIAEELAALSVKTDGARKEVSFKQGFDWDAVEALYLAPVTFELDPEFFAERWDQDSRDYIDATVGETDREFLSERLTRRVSYKLDDLRSIVEEAGDDILTVEPVITFVSRSRPGVDQLARRPGLDVNSVGAGEAAMRFNVRDAEGDLVASIYYRRDTSFLDQQPRPTEWSDATYVFGLAAGVLKKELKKLGLRPSDDV